MSTSSRKNPPPTGAIALDRSARNLSIDGRIVKAIPTRALYMGKATRRSGVSEVGVRDVGVRADITPPFVDPTVLAVPPPAPDEPDNLVLGLIAQADDPIKIMWGGFGDAYKDDKLSFRLDGVEFDSYVVLENDTPPYIGELPKALRSEGLHKLTVFYNGGSGVALSDEVPIVFDYTAPGDGLLIGPLLFDPADDIEGTGITAEKFRTDENGVRYIWAEVAGYAGHATGDRVHLYCNGEEAPDVGIALIVDKHIEVHITEDFLKVIEDTPEAVFTYKIEDRAEWISEDSMAKTVAIQLVQITTLVAPTVPSFDDDPDDPANQPLIDYADSRGTTNQGFIVVVPWHDEYEYGDKIMLSLKGANGELNAGLVPLGPTGQDMEILFPFVGTYLIWLDGSTGGTEDKRVPADVSYTVVRGPASAGRSPDHPVVLNLYNKAIDPLPVTPVNERLQKPVVRSKSGSIDEIPLVDFGIDGNNVEIAKLTDANHPPITGAFDVGDTLRIYYGTQPFFTFDVLTLDPPNDPLVVPIPKETIQNQGSGPAVPVWFEVVHELADGGTNINLSPTKPIMVAGIDTQPGNGHLDAGNFPDQDDEGKIPENPYHYTSTRFDIPDYANRSPDDTIELHLEIFPGPTHQTNEKPMAGLDYDTTYEAGIENPISVSIPSSVYNLYPIPDLPTRKAHIHATYTVTKKTGDMTPVTSDQASVTVDSRFSNGPD